MEFNQAVEAGPGRGPGHLSGGPAVSERLLQGIGDELGAEVVCNRPADDPAAVEVLHRDQVEPALPAAQ